MKEFGTLFKRRIDDNIKFLIIITKKNPHNNKNNNCNSSMFTAKRKF